MHRQRWRVWAGRQLLLLTWTVCKTATRSGGVPNRGRKIESNVKIKLRTVQNENQAPAGAALAIRSGRS